MTKLKTINEINSDIDKELYYSKLAEEDRNLKEKEACDKMTNKEQWDKVYCKNCKKYLGRLNPKCCFCNSKCQGEYSFKQVELK